jgi:hypothetical protein
MIHKKCLCAAIAALVLTGSALAQSASLIFQDDFESYSAGAYNFALQKSNGGKWWMIQNSVTAPGCASVTPDQHKIVTTSPFQGSKCMRVYYDTMEQWSGGQGCRWRAEAAERLTSDGLTTGVVEVWQGYAIKPTKTNGNPWAKRCMGTTGSDLNCVGLRDNLSTHVSQFIGDEDGNKLVAVDVVSDLADYSSARYFWITGIGRIANVNWDQWNTVVLHVKTGKRGFVEAWVNGVYMKVDQDLWTASNVYDVKFGIYGDRVDTYAQTFVDVAKVAQGGIEGYNLVNPNPSTTAGTFISQPGINWQCGTPGYSQSGTYTARFDSVPGASNLDGVVGLCRGYGTAFSDYACMVRFNSSGRIDARNGGAYAAAVSVPYTANTKYSFRLVMNVPAHTYSIYVTPQGGSEILLGSNYAFRTEQNQRGSLNNWGQFVAGAAGTLTTNNFLIQ